VTINQTLINSDPAAFLLHEESHLVVLTVLCGFDSIINRDTFRIFGRVTIGFTDGLNKRILFVRKVKSPVKVNIICK